MTPKQEAFARFYVELQCASKAYRKAYNASEMQENTVWSRASELLKHSEVAARVREMQERSAKRTEITVEKLTEMTIKAYTEAQREHPTSGQMQTASMIKAAEFLGKLHGLVVERSEVVHKSGPEDLDDEELADIARGGRRGNTEAAERPQKPN